MKKIYEQTSIVKQMLDKQKVDINKKYRKIMYTAQCPVEDGVLIINTITYEFIFLSNEEFKLLDKPDFDNPVTNYLIEQYFLVPQDFDDKSFGKQLIDTRVQIQNIFTNPRYCSFVILTTTGCNARCFYCFEKGAKVSNMTEQTAHDVADFIERKGEKKVKIQWFGGEPLVNTKAIDIISRDLKEKNIKFESKMVSNAYLLDEENIKKAVELWNLKKIQITLDGTEEVYNKVKNYVYKDVSSPFIKVLNNIENTLKAGISVSIRLNMDEHNTEDLFDLSKQLVERFNKYKNCHIYVVRLFEDTCSKIKNRDVADRHKLIENAMELSNFISANMPIPQIEKLQKSVETPSSCMACIDKAVVIVPDGHLGKCEHYVDSGFIGSIYSDEVDVEKIQKYKERVQICDKCEDCELRSLCMPLKCCSGKINHCDELDKKAHINRLNSTMLNVYNKFLEDNE